ncbi:MAG: hypothetical protein ACRDP9_23635 [Kribbellaceae bacterium]
MTVPDPDLAPLLPSWELALRAERKSPQTGKTYGDGVRAYLRWCDANDRPAVLSRRQLAGFVDALLSDGAQPAPGRVPLMSTTARGLRHDRAPAYSGQARWLPTTAGSGSWGVLGLGLGGGAPGLA